MTEQSASRAPFPGGAATSRTSAIALWLTGVVVVPLTLLYAFATPYLLGLSSMCRDDFDTSDCASEQAEAVTPLVLGVVAVVLWSVGTARRRRPGSAAWALGGVVVVAIPIFRLWLAASG